MADEKDDAIKLAHKLLDQPMADPRAVQAVATPGAPGW